MGTGFRETDHAQTIRAPTSHRGLETRCDVKRGLRQLPWRRPRMFARKETATSLRGTGDKEAGCWIRCCFIAAVALPKAGASLTRIAGGLQSGRCPTPDLRFARLTFPHRVLQRVHSTPSQASPPLAQCPIVGD